MGGSRRDNGAVQPRSLQNGSSFPGSTATDDDNEPAPFLGSAESPHVPDRLLVMLCDRLMLDVQRGVAAIEFGNSPESHDQLFHADDIVMELHSSLTTQGWVGDPGLANLCNRLHSQLVRADVSKDVRIALDCLGIATDLAQSLGRLASPPVPDTAAAS